MAKFKTKTKQLLSN